jgi:hypothetical protein
MWLTRIVLVLLALSAVQAEKDYTDLVTHLKENIENKTGIFYHSAYQRLAYISDTFGPRMWGSPVLEMVID